MIKVLHFFKTYYPDTMGGIEQVIFQLAEGGMAHGIQSEVLHLSGRGSARGEKVGNHLTHRSKLDLHVASTGFSLSAGQRECQHRAGLRGVQKVCWPCLGGMHR